MGTISQDPIGFSAGDANLYRYVGNGPTNATDPSGLEVLFPADQAKHIEPLLRRLFGDNIGFGDSNHHGLRYATAFAGGGKIDPKLLGLITLFELDPSENRDVALAHVATQIEKYSYHKKLGEIADILNSFDNGGDLLVTIGGNGLTTTHSRPINNSPTGAHHFPGQGHTILPHRTQARINGLRTKNVVTTSLLSTMADVAAGEAVGIVGSSVARSLRVAPKNADDLITVYRGMGQTEFNALSRGGPLQSIAERAGTGAKPGFFQKYFRHSIDSANPPSPYVSLSQSPGAARHFIIDGMPSGFRGALKDFAIRTGLSKPVISDGKVLARITMRRSDLSRTFHYAQDELVALGGTRIHSIQAVANPALQSHLSWRVYAGAAGQIGVGAGVPSGVGYGIWYAYSGDE
ncbi:hypothetical protein NHH03_20310 [Stieleria sp. TO1_6]|uniref:hypothetical protein n=1 Tax=Stieleria tagensis TaxID=2956795 RepID=UPI00209B8A40|nr:hypothetical protein [Stieleria tagensis]MCO8124099.1 hypothetical protein [Stieleria tagensis]